MTDAEINEAIAKTCGWTKCHSQGHLQWGCDPATGYEQQLPRYAIDLNAMNKAEEAVIWKKELAYRYDVELEKVLADNPYPWSATARQRAEAFLRTFSLWQE